MADISDSSNWFETDASNNRPPPAGWPEGQMPSTVNDCSRAMMGAMKRFWDRINPTLPAITQTGGVWQYNTTETAYPIAYVEGETYAFLTAGAAVGADQLKINILAAKPIYKLTAAGPVATAANDWYAGAMPRFAYQSALNAGAGGFLLLDVPYVPVSADSSGNVSVPGNLSTAGTLTVTGASTLHGNTTVGGTLGVTGATTLSTLTVTGATTLDGSTATTPATADNSTNVATTAFVKAQGYATTAAVAAGYLPLTGGSVSGSLTVAGNVIGNNSVQSNGVYFQNNGGSFYTPQQFLSGSNVVASGAVYAGGGGGVYFQNNSGYFYTPNAFQCAGGQANGAWTVTGGLQANGNINAGSGNNIGGVGLSSNNVSAPGDIHAGGTMYCGGSDRIRLGRSGVGAIDPYADDWGYVGLSGTAFVAMEAYSYYNGSDPRGKKDMAQAPNGALDKVCAVPVITYRKKSEPGNAPLRTGFDASMVQRLFKVATVKVGDDPDHSLSLNMMDMIAQLWQAVQELSMQVADLKAAANG